MSCATASLSKNSGWTSTFPAEMTTLKNATLFIKKLLAVAISNIAYLRNIFPERAFGCRNLSDLTLKILSDNTTCAAASQVINWVKSCFDALDKKYLRQIMLGIHAEPDDHDNVIEAYTFRFTYTDQGTSVTCNGAELPSLNEHDTQFTKRATLSLLRTIIVLTQTLEPLPTNSYMTMKLLYYDDVTPPDYEPSGFVPAKTDNFFFSGSPVNIRAGEVSTGYHSMKVRIKADKKQFEIPEEEVVPSNSIQMDSSYQNEDSPKPSYMGSEDSFNGETWNMNEEFAEAEQKAFAEDGVSLGDPAKSANKEGESKRKTQERKDGTSTVRCPCGYQEKEGLMVFCEKCYLWQHGTCFGVLEENETPRYHVCELCYKMDEKAFEPNDKDFYNLPLVDIQAVCLWRRALVTICDLKAVQSNVLQKRLKIEKSVAVEIIDRLEDEGYVIPGSGKLRGKKFVNHTAIKRQGIPKYVKGSTRSVLLNQNASVDELNVKTGQLQISSTPHASAPYQLRGKKRGKENHQDFGEGSSSQEFECGSETRQKRKKASTCISGISLPQMM